jgi:hypothetical protein
MASIEGYHDLFAICLKPVHAHAWVDIRVLMHGWGTCDFHETEWSRRCRKWLSVFHEANNILDPCHDEDRLRRPWCQGATMQVDAFPVYMDGRNTVRFELNNSGLRHDGSP